MSFNFQQMWQIHHNCRFAVLPVIFATVISLCIAEHSPKLLLISFDGFRWDYLSHSNNTPNFDRLISGGVKAKWIKDLFTSLTFPNHYTIVTGMYEESHGIVANMFYDPVFDEVFNITNKTTVKDGKFWGGEPIWVTNQLQGGRTGVYFWVGSEAEIKGIRPTYYENYTNPNFSMELWKNRTDTVIQWMTDPDKVVDLALLYFKEPDHTGHLFGPDSAEVAKMIEQCDKITGYILDQIEEHGLTDMVNVIITSDHGMTSMDRSRFVTLDDHIHKNETNHLINYVVGTSVWPKENYTDDLYNDLSNISDHVSVWRKEDIPPEYHYTKNRRIPPILLSADEGWGIKENWDDPKYLLGRHGFNNSEMDMHPFFVATGPAFKKNYISEPFENVHIYELMCHILGIKSAPNNGSLEAVRHLLEEEEESKSIEPDEETLDRLAKWAGVSVGVVIAFGLLFFVGKQVCKIQDGKKRRLLPRSNVQYDELQDRELLLDRV